MPRVQRGKILHAWWDAGDDLAWHSGGIGATLHVFVEAGEIHCDHHMVAPCEGLADRDLLDHPFGDHGGELGLNSCAPLERNSARPIEAARDCVIQEVNVHRRPGHRTKRCIFEDCREFCHDAGLQDGHLEVRLCGSGGWCRGSAKWWMGRSAESCCLESRVGPAFFKEAQSDAGRLAQQRHVQLAVYVESGVARAALQVQNCWDGAQRLELVTVGCVDGMVVWGQIFE